MKVLRRSILLFVLSLSGCSSLTLKPGDFSWPVESVMSVDAQGMIQEDRYSFSVNVKPLLLEETGDTTHLRRVTLRVIRDVNGYYFVTGSQFKRVYVFAQTEGGLKLEKKISITETGLDAPAFNQRPPYIQLLSAKEKPLLLSKDGIQQGGKQ